MSEREMSRVLGVSQMSTNRTMAELKILIIFYECADKNDLNWEY